MPAAGQTRGRAAGSFVDPAPGGTVGRTDEGVDWSNIKGNVVAVASGVITAIYQKLSGFGTTVVEQVDTGEYVYYAEETGASDTAVRKGQRVAQGDTIARGRGTGGIEVGYWDPSTGRALGARGYSEGKPTQAGASFRNRIGSGNISRAPAQPQPSTPITRPGGGGTSAGNAAGIKTILQGYTGLRDMPRTAPPGTKNPTKWFLASFTGKWDQFAGSSSSGGGGGSSSSAASDVVGKVTRTVLEKVGSSYGWSGQEIDDWLMLIQDESGGDPNAVNKSTGAFGIGQMLAPGGSPSNLGPNKAKYAQYGGDWRTVLGQLKGMGGYIRQRYGSPSAALAHENSNHWY